VAQKWYFRNREKTWGPFSTPEIKNLAAAGLLQSHDLIWPEGGDSREAAEAAAFVDFFSLERVAVPAPDWLDDVQEEKGPRSVKQANPIPLDWLADVGHWESLEKAPGEAPAEAERTAATTLLPPSPVPTVVTPANASAPVAPPVATTEPRSTVIRLMGFDTQTGEILDPERFKEWKNEQRNQRGALGQTAKTIQVIFEEARRAVEGWVDEDHNRELIMKGDWGVIHKDANLHNCLSPYRNYGPAMLEKLWHHLRFMVENRRKFYAAYPKN